MHAYMSNNNGNLAQNNVCSLSCAPCVCSGNEVMASLCGVSPEKMCAFEKMAML